MIYCDDCADKYGYAHTEEKRTGGCDICKMRMGKLNVMPEDQFDQLINGISLEVFNLSGFEVNEVKGFPRGTKPSDIEPKITNLKKAAPNCVVFFDSHKLVVANSQTGKRFQIRF